MSDWEDFCESKGWNPGSEEDYEKFLEGLEERPIADTCEEVQNKEQLNENREFFYTFKEALAWAKERPGRAFTRSIDGNHFSKKKNLNPPSKDKSADLHQVALTETFEKTISELSPHVTNIYHTASSRFRKEAFVSDLSKLNKPQIKTLISILEKYTEREKIELKNRKKHIRMNRLKAENYGVDETLQWIDVIEKALKICTEYLSKHQY